MSVTAEKKLEFCKTFLFDRQRARTDLFYLCNEILAPHDSRILVPHAHQPIVDHCQKLYGREEFMDPDTLQLKYSKPKVAMWDLEDSRDRMLLYPRGHLKTTIHAVGHSIQWILNYPDVRILLCSSTGDQVQRILKEIKEHFQYNKVLRFYFPEFCPETHINKKLKIADFGNAEEFTVPNRTRKWKEPTVMCASLGKAVASTRYEVIMASDVISEANTKTKGQIQEAKDFFGYLEPLRERGPSKNEKPNPAWKFVEGTIYDFADYYQTILDHEEKLAAERRGWKITKRSCWKDKANRIPLWPERFPPDELDRILNSPEVGPYIFGSQYELNPVAPGTGLATPEQIVYVKHQVLKSLMPRYRVYTTIDLATLEDEATGDNIAMVTAGWDGNARLDVLAIQHGHFSDQQLVDMMFLTQQVFPSNQEFRVQKDHISGGLKALLRREMERRNKWLNVKFVPIPTNESKTHRIIRNLQGWFALKLIRFSDAIPVKTQIALKDEILRFPRGAHDDIIDALADQMHNAEGDPVTDAIPRGRTAEVAMQEDYGFNPYGQSVEPNMEDHYAEVVGL